MSRNPALGKVMCQGGMAKTTSLRATIPIESVLCTRRASQDRREALARHLPPIGRSSSILAATIAPPLCRFHFHVLSKGLTECTRRSVK